MTDYAEQRRAYVSQVRSSFGQETDQMQTPPKEGAGTGARIRFGAAAVLFVLFLFWQGTGGAVCGYTPAKVIDMIEDNRYDTILQECDALLQNVIHEDTR